MSIPRIGALAASLLAATLAGCGGGADEAAQGARPSGEVVVDGSSTVYRISHAAQEGFAEVNPDVNVIVSNHGTGGGFGAYLRGEVDIVDASRPAKPEEEEQARQKGLEWTLFHVGYDGITVVVHPKNAFVKSLTAAQLKALFEPGSKVATWKDLDPSWPDRKINLYTPDKDSGTFEFFTQVINGKAGAQRDDVQASPDDNTLVKGVAGDEDGIGYFGYAYFEANKDKLRAVPIEDQPGKGPVAPSPETILNKSYSPLSRRLYIYVKNASLSRPAVAAFVKYYLENVEELAREGGYVPPTPDDRAQNRQAVPVAAARPDERPRGTTGQ